MPLGVERWLADVGIGNVEVLAMLAIMLAVVAALLALQRRRLEMRYSPFFMRMRATSRVSPLTTMRWRSTSGAMPPGWATRAASRRSTVETSSAPRAQAERAASDNPLPSWPNRSTHARGRAKVSRLLM